MTPPPTAQNLYCELFSFRNIYLAYLKARKGKGAKWYVREFESEVRNNLLQLQKELQEMTYNPQPLKQFSIKDPKTRLISAAPFRDRVVHHALCNVIEPIFEKIFIYDSYANRKGKGTYAALNRFDYFKRKVSGNGKILPDAKNSNHVYGYVLKADIRHYFDSVDHKVMMQIISKRIKDEKMLWLIQKILENHSLQKGMPLGNMTSQFFANVYLNELDYFVKHELKAKYYIRYVDDFVILDASKQKLELYKAEISEFLKTIKLELHPQKSNIVPLHSGATFLGFRVFYNYKLLKRSNARRIPCRLQNLIDNYADCIIGKDEIYESFEGWNAYAMHASTYKFRMCLMRKLIKAINKIDEVERNRTVSVTHAT